MSSRVLRAETFPFGTLTGQQGGFRHGGKTILSLLCCGAQSVDRKAYSRQLVLRAALRRPIKRIDLQPGFKVLRLI
jgi:predicted ribonuclease YlaK